MDYFDELKPTSRKKPPVNPAGLLNVATVLLFLGFISAILFFGRLYTHPLAPINPFPPYLTPTPVVFPPTPTSIVPALPSTTSAPEAPAFTATFAPTSTNTVTPTSANTPFVIILPTSTTAPTSEPGLRNTESPYPFVVVNGGPAAMRSSLMLPDLGCNWLGVGGNVVDLQGAPVIGLRVQLYGSFHRVVMSEMSISGAVDRYGSAGYEITIDDKPSVTNGTMWVQLFNQAGGTLSDKIFFDTTASCDENLIIINFKQVR